MNHPLFSLEAAIAEEVANNGYAITPGYLSSAQIAALVSDLRTLHENGAMRGAGIGKDAEVTQSVRSDFIHWLEDPAETPAQQYYMEKVEHLRQAFNQTLYLGLFDFEGHFACYPPGGFYRKHLDQFRQDSLRTLTAILYLNDDWQPEDGGQLRMYLDGENAEPFLDIQPLGGTLVTFLSNRFWHEVLPSQRERLSITGWFRTRDSQLV